MQISPRTSTGPPRPRPDPGISIRQTLAVATKPELRCAGADCRLELRLSSRAAGKWAQDRQVDPGSAVCFDPLAAMLRRSGDAGGVDQCIADGPLGGFPISSCPGSGKWCRLFGGGEL